MQSIGYTYTLGPFHTRLRAMRTSRSRARDTLFLLLHYYGPCTRKELISKAHGQISGLSVYKNLPLLVRIGVAQEIKPGLFELTDRFNQHHHFMWCRICHQPTGFYNEALEKALIKAFGQRGFAMEDHNIVITGICPKCLLNPANKPRPAIGTRLRRYILQP